jgi:hypothetical protein
MDIAGAVCAYLSGIREITNELQIWEPFIGVPAIFQGDTVPALISAKDGSFIAVDFLSSVNDDTFTENGVEARVNVRLYGPASASAAAIQDLAWAIRTALHRKAFPVPGARMLVARAQAPIPAPTSGPEVFGRSIAALVSVEEI